MKKKEGDVLRILLPKTVEDTAVLEAFCAEAGVDMNKLHKRIGKIIGACSLAYPLDGEQQLQKLFWTYLFAGIHYGRTKAKKAYTYEYQDPKTIEEELKVNEEEVEEDENTRPDYLG